MFLSFVELILFVVFIVLINKAAKGCMTIEINRKL